MSPFKTDEFKRLQAEWNKKLKDDGVFIDIEDSCENFIDHQAPSDFSQRIHFKAEIIEISNSYWAWAADALYCGVFKHSVDKKIWELHVNGKTGSEISFEVNLERTWVNRKIQRITRYLKAQEYPVRSVLPYIQSK